MNFTALWSQQILQIIKNTHLSESSEDSDLELNYKFQDKLAEDPKKSISNDPQLLEPLIIQYKKDYSPVSNKISLKKWWIPITH